MEASVAEDFIRIEITKNGKQQYLKLVKKDGTKQVYKLNNFSYCGGGPVIVGEYEIQFKENE